MDEIFSAFTSSINLPYNILLGFTVFYWGFVMVGFVDIEMFDVDLDLDADADVDTDIDLEHGGGFMTQLLMFFNIGDVPIMLLVNILTIFLWFFGMLGNFYLNPTQSLLVTGLIFVPNLVVSSIFTKYCSIPFKKFYKLFNGGHAHGNVIGSMGVVTSIEVTEKYGQIELFTDDGSVVKLNVVVEGENLKKGDEVIVFSNKDNEDDIFIITKSNINRIEGELK